MNLGLGLGLPFSRVAGPSFVGPSLAPVLDVQTTLGSDEASLTWTASNQTGSAGFGYKVELDIDGGGFNEIANTTNLFYTDTQGSAAGETYTYRITPYNDYGEGPSSNEAGVVLPGEPEGPVLTGPVYSSEDYTIEWTSVTNATSYDIYSSVDGVSFSLLANTPLNFRNITHAYPGMYFYVIAKNAIASSQPSNTLHVNVLPAFDTDGFVAGFDGWGENAIGSDISPDYEVAVNLSWDAYTGATSYQIARGIAGVYTVIGTTAGTSFRDDTVDWDDGDGPTYTYGLAATNGYDWVSGGVIGPFTPQEPPVPTSFKLQLNAGGNILLNAGGAILIN
jgi:hypothetical protein